MNENNYSVYHIGDIRTLVEIRCADGSEGALGFGQVNKIEEIIEFERDYMMKQDFEVLRINRLPHSKRVVLFCGVSRTKEKLIVRQDSQLGLYYLLERFSFGSFTNGREAKYKNVYQVYESLEEFPDYRFTAIRHALSHPTITKIKTIEAIRAIFADDHINFNKNKHKLIFKSIFDELEIKSQKLLVSELLRIRGTCKESIGEYYIL